jgi:hypothetical protein
VRETVATLQRAIAAAGLSPADVKAIVLAGGSSRIPLVAEMVHAELGRPVVLDAHPKHTVALGAARVAEQLPAGDAIVPPSTPAAATPAPPPTPAAPVADAPVAGAPPQPPAPAAPPTVLPPPQPVGGGRSRRGPVLVGAIIGLLAAAALVAVLALGGDDDPDETADATTTTGAPTSSGAATATTPPCTVPSGRCAFVDSITIEGDHFVVAYTPVGYVPDIDGGRNSHHIHFYFDNIPASQAGHPGSGPWELWDFDPNGKALFPNFKRAAVPSGATSICAVVATNEHALDPGTVPSCRPIPA